MGRLPTVPTDIGFDIVFVGGLRRMGVWERANTGGQTVEISHLHYLIAGGLA